MSEAEVNIDYQTSKMSLLHAALFLSLPVAVIYLLWSTCVLLLAVDAGTIRYGPTGVVMLAQVLAFGFLVILTILSSDTKIFLTRDGISLPFFVLPGPRYRTEFTWSQLASVHFRPHKQSGILTLLFKNGRTAKLNLAALAPRAVDGLLVALDVWGGGLDSFPALLEARSHIAGVSMVASDDHSFTNMWEEELSRRFGATNFIPLEPGHKLSQGDETLTVERQLAFGGLSAIYLVTDDKQSKMVMKEAVIPPDADSSIREQSIAMLERESRHLAKLNHPGIARVFDYFVDQDRHYLLMEHLEGSDLRRLVKEEGKRPASEVYQWAKEITEIVRYLHAQEPPIIHRDLSPDNIILREDGSISIIDFGAANHFLGTATQTLIGKQAYISPEQLRGKATQQSDIYSLGATLHFLLTGEDPEPLSVAHPKHINPSVPPSFDELIGKCTQLDGDKRVQSAATLAEALQGLRI